MHSLHGIGAATSLISFDAQFSYVRGPFPEEITRLSNLRTLSLGENGITGTLPKSFASLPFLMSLRLNANELTGKLPAFDDIHFLKYVDLSDNALTGAISRKFFDKLSIDVTPEIRLSRNQLTGVVQKSLIASGT